MQLSKITQGPTVILLNSQNSSEQGNIYIHLKYLMPNFTKIKFLKQLIIVVQD